MGLAVAEASDLEFVPVGLRRLNIEFNQQKRVALDR